jgi:hypothetical protein
MIAQADLLGADWRLLYGGRRETSLAFGNDLAAYGETRPVSAPGPVRAPWPTRIPHRLAARYSHVARLEAESLLTALAARVSRIEFAGPVARHRNNTLRAWHSIPVRLYRY